MHEIRRAERQRRLLSGLAGLAVFLTAAALPLEIRAEKPVRTSGFGEILIIRREEAPKTFDALAEEAAKAEEEAGEEAADKKAKQRPKPDNVKYLPGNETEDLIKKNFGDIEPIIHIHRKFYSGPIEYQGPFMVGGRTIVVAADPRTNRRRQTAIITLPSGAPLIVYDRKSVTYVFDNRRFIFRFPGRDCCKIKVSQKSGVGAGRTLTSFAQNISTRVRDRASQMPLTESVRTKIHLLRDTAGGAFGVATGAAGQALDKAGQAFEAIPVVQMLKSAAQQGPERGQVEKLRQQGEADARNARQFVPTNR